MKKKCWAASSAQNRQLVGGASQLPLDKSRSFCNALGYSIRLLLTWRDMIGYIVKFSWLKSRNFKSSWAKVQANQGHKTKKHALANCVRRIQKLIGVSSLVEIVFPIWKQLQTQMIRFRKILLERVPITLFLVRNYSTIYSHTVCIHTPNSRQVSMR